MSNENARTYPYKAWTLQPSFKPVEVELTERHYGKDWDQTANRKGYHVSTLHPTKEAAIAYGRAEVERIQADLDKRTENLRKKRTALNLAAKP